MFGRVFVAYTPAISEEESDRLPVILGALSSLAMVWVLAALLPGSQQFRIYVNLVAGVFDAATLLVGYRYSWRKAGFLWVWAHIACSAAVTFDAGQLHTSTQMIFVIITMFSAWVTGVRHTVVVVVLICALLQLMLFQAHQAEGDWLHILWEQRHQTFFFIAVLCLAAVFTLSARMIARKQWRRAVRARQALQVQTDLVHKLYQAVEQSADAFLLVDYDGKIEYANNVFLREAGYTLEEVIGQQSTLFSLTALTDQEHREMRQSIENGQRWHKVLTNHRRDGSTIMEQVTIAPLFGSDGSIHHFVEIKHNIEEQLRQAQQLSQLEQFDALTHLLNRSSIWKHIDQLLTPEQTPHAPAPQQDWHGLMLVNLDRFQRINDALGAETGDLLLQKVATLMRTRLPSATTQVGRIAGDEFVIVLQHAGSSRQDARSTCTAVARRLQYWLARLSEADADILPAGMALHASIGITVFPFVEPGTTCDSSDLVMRRAGTALKEAKRKGRGRIELYRESLITDSNQKFELEAALREAIARQDLRVYLQNQVGEQSQLLGMEALIRWHHPTKGFISPGQFIPLAEESHLIVDIGDWVREECCRFLALPQVREKAWSVSINVSAREFQEEQFVDKVHQSTLRHGIAPQRLVLELTETVLLEDTHATTFKLKALRALGFEFALDDFGTGYSSLSYLQHLPVQELKIDQSFVQSLHDPRNATLVKAILQVAKGFGLRVVAEGVETPVQIDFLRQAMPGIYLQGYGLHRPEAMDAWLIHHAPEAPQAPPTDMPEHGPR